jgi:hypothetical protein
MEEAPTDPQTKGRSQYVGLAGEHYVVYSLLVRGFHASVVGGNVPNVDVLVSSVNGSKQISLQVKTSRQAYRRRRWRHEVYEFEVGRSAVGRQSPNHWYALVDLQEGNSPSWTPVVYLVPSLWVDTWASRCPNAPRQMYPLKATASHLCRERWDHVQNFFADDPKVVGLTKTIPPEASWE